MAPFRGGGDANANPSSSCHIGSLSLSVTGNVNVDVDDRPQVLLSEEGTGLRGNPLTECGSAAEERALRASERGGGEEGPGERGKEKHALAPPLLALPLRLSALHIEDGARHGALVVSSSAPASTGTPLQLANDRDRDEEGTKFASTPRTPSRYGRNAFVDTKTARENQSAPLGVGG